jgi:hypothetical protein
MGHASAAFTLTVYGHLFDADLDALACLDGQTGEFRSVSRHDRGMNEDSDDGAQHPRVADQR